MLARQHETHWNIMRNLNTNNCCEKKNWERREGIRQSGFPITVTSRKAKIAGSIYIKLVQIFWGLFFVNFTPRGVTSNYLQPQISQRQPVGENPVSILLLSSGSSDYVSIKNETICTFIPLKADSHMILSESPRKMGTLRGSRKLFHLVSAEWDDLRATLFNRSKVIKISQETLRW